MAVKDLTTNKITALNKWTEIETDPAAATAAADGVTVNYADVRDKQVLIIAKNTHESAAKTVTLKGGNGKRASQDLDAVSIASGDSYGIVVDSAYFVNETGTAKDKLLIIPSSTDITFYVIALPY